MNTIPPKTNAQFANSLAADTANLNAIERRGQEMVDDSSVVFAKFAHDDIEDFQKISQPNYRRFAAVQIADNCAALPEYRAAFESVATQHLAQEVETLNAQNQTLIHEKEIRKGAEFMTMQNDPDLQRRIVEEDNRMEQEISALVVSAGSHIGVVVKTQISAGRIAQKIGRDPDKVVWHDVANLKGPVPKFGEMAQIDYSNGIGVVKEPAHELGPAR